ncbi:MAG: UbiX family flavin prenyltransferase [Bacteroidetes bacterium]|nr:UbiX family flavin prenyltransferase [Bacteroidota bacterium]
MKNKIVVAVTGASGAIYAKVLLDKLQAFKEEYDEIGVVVSKNAEDVWKHELGEEGLKNYSFKYYGAADFYAPFASGSAGYNVMIICPCSMGTLGRIASGTSADLISRAADVMLKERGRLILVIRDTPYNLIHIKNMETVTMAGGIICPASPSFYSKPADFEQLVSTVIDRVLDLAGMRIDTFRWGDEQ